jgi:hypothetical protein
MHHPASIRTPRFRSAQPVSFPGGEGVVRGHKIEDENRIYLIEMPLGLKPVFGRVGAETMVLLAEADLWAA